MNYSYVGLSVVGDSATTIKAFSAKKATTKEKLQNWPTTMIQPPPPPTKKKTTYLVHGPTQQIMQSFNIF